ncbi:hypothetical protein [Streptomyces sp. NPDC046942]|uniref:hypothetical protein n=1 Tax=Streptomyces sp. NPDC046942 TaxID=3155137 RepID=UPI0033F05292
MKPNQIMSAIVLLCAAVAITACGSQQDSSGNGATKSKQATMDEQQASARAEEIVHQAVEGMSPKPTLKRTGLRPLGACIARDDGGPDDRVQYRLTYQLTGVPGSDAKTLVRQARDAWVKLGYKFQSQDGDWSDPFPSVSMRTEPDDFWMTALTGVVNRAKGEGLAAISVTSPCFAPSQGASGDSTAFHRTQVDENAEHLALAHSSRIYDALHVRHAPAQAGDGISVYQDAEGSYVHHAWSTQPLSEEETAQALARVRTYFESAGWTVRHVLAEAGVPALVARNVKDESVAQVAPSATGAVRVAVTTPVAPEKSASI